MQAIFISLMVVNLPPQSLPESLVPTPTITPNLWPILLEKLPFEAIKKKIEHLNCRNILFSQTTNKLKPENDENLNVLHAIRFPADDFILLTWQL